MMKMTKKDRPVYVIGHKNPDTDAIAASICYAYLKNLTSDESCEARRCGNISSETQYVLDRFHVRAPRFIGDVRTQVRDMDIRKLSGADAEMSLKEAWLLMKENQVVTLCVTEGRKLKGLITTGDIMESYMGAWEPDILARARTSYRNITETLDGEMIVGCMDDVLTEGKILIAAGTPDQTESVIRPGDIVIVGDRYEAQLSAIETEAGCLIVSSGSRVTASILKMAAARGTRIIVTPHDTFTVARLINQSLPIRYFMKDKDLITFKPDDYIEDVRPVMASTRHRYFPVVDAGGNYRGMVSRRNFLGVHKKRLILVDHNEKSQAVNGVETAEILEIIDHHRIGAVTTQKPIFFRNQPLGSTCTILYSMFLEAGREIPVHIAGLMLSAILSDTLFYRSPTCTETDRKAGAVLATIAGVKEEELAREMFHAGSSFGSKTPREIIHQDYKKFRMGDKTVAIGQISSLDARELETVRSQLLQVLEETRKEDGADLIYVMLTNIIQESSEVIFAGENAESTIENAFMTTSRNHKSVCLSGVVSRKKQMVPSLSGAIEQEGV